MIRRALRRLALWYLNNDVSHYDCRWAAWRDLAMENEIDRLRLALQKAARCR